MIFDALLYKLGTAVARDCSEKDDGSLDHVVIVVFSFIVCRVPPSVLLYYFVSRGCHLFLPYQVYRALYVCYAFLNEKYRFQCHYN